MARFEVDFLPEFSEQALIEEMQRVARALERTLFPVATSINTGR